MSRDNTQRKLREALQKRGLMVDGKNSFKNIRNSKKSRAMRIAIQAKQEENETYD